MPGHALPHAAPGVPTARRTVRWPAGGVRWVIGLSVLLIWQLLAAAGAPTEQALASPREVTAVARALLDDGTLPRAAGVSLLRAGAGFVVGALAGVALAALASLARPRRRPRPAGRTGPLGVLPHVAVLPLLVAWWGPGETSTLVLVAVGAAVPTYLHAREGLAHRETGLEDAATSLRLTRRQRVRHVTLPGALPDTFAGLRLGLGAAWLSVVVAEQLLVGGGLGALVAGPVGTDVIVVGVAGYAALALVTHLLLGGVERRVLAWR